jgi:putative component of toxin-antitoxin plasmid stabilization module
MKKTTFDYIHTLFDYGPGYPVYFFQSWDDIRGPTFRSSLLLLCGGDKL